MEKSDQKIYDEIEQQINRSRTVYDKKALTTHKGKKGLLFPFTVTAVSLLLFAATLLGVRFYNRATAPVHSATQTVSEVGAINQIIRELKAQAELKIQDQEGQIALLAQQIQAMQTTVGTDRNQLQDKLNRRKSEFEIEIKQKINDERTRLELLQLARNEIEKRLRDYETTIREAYNKKLLVYRQQLESEISVKEHRLADLKKEYRIKHDESMAEIEKIRQEAASQQKQYDRQLIRLNRQMVQEMNSASSDLTALQKRKEKEEQVTHQLNGLYFTVNQAIRQKNYPEAAAQLENLRKFTHGPLYLSVPSLVWGAETDSMMIEWLADYLHLCQAEQERVRSIRQFGDREEQQLLKTEEAYNRHMEKVLQALEQSQMETAVSEFKAALTTVSPALSSLAAFESLLKKQEALCEAKAALQLAGDFESADSEAKARLQADFTETVNGLREEADRLRETLRQGAEQNDRLSASVSKLQAERKQLTAKNQRLSATLSQKNAALAALNREKSKSDSTIQDLLAQIRQLQAQPPIPAEKAAQPAASSDTPSGDQTRITAAQFQAKAAELTKAEAEIKRLQEELTKSVQKTESLKRALAQLQKKAAAAGKGAADEKALLASPRYQSLLKANEQLEADNRQLLAEIKSLQQKHQDANSTEEEAQKIINRSKTISKSYQSLLREFKRLDSNDPYALLTLENSISRFFNQPELQSTLPGFSNLFRDYTRTLQNKANDRDKIYTSITNTLKEIATYPTRETMMTAIDDLIRYERNNPFRVAFLTELKKTLAETAEKSAS